MSDKVRMSLVQGIVTLKISIDGMVSTKFAGDENYMRNWFINMASANIRNADEDFEYDNQVDVLISKETAKKYENQEISDEDWKKIVAEYRANQ